MSQIGAILIKIIFIFVGLLCIVFSYLIGVMGKTTLIAGYDPKKVKDKRGLSRFIGIMTLIVGLFTVVFPMTYGPDKAKPAIWILCYCLPVILMVLIMIVGSSKYGRKSIE